MTIIVQHVPCCVCHATGKVRGWFLKRVCTVCAGSGHRRIIMDDRFTDAEKATVLDSAILGMNMRAPSTWESLIGQSMNLF